VLKNQWLKFFCWCCTQSWHHANSVFFQVTDWCWIKTTENLQNLFSKHFYCSSAKITGLLKEEESINTYFGGSGALLS
jgi:hypothetical protein